MAIVLFFRVIVWGECYVFHSKNNRKRKANFVEMGKNRGLIIREYNFKYFDNACPSEQAEIISGLIEYFRTGKKPEAKTRFLRMAFADIIDDMERDREKYEAMRERRREAGKKGAQVRWGKVGREAEDAYAIIFKNVKGKN